MGSGSVGSGGGMGDAAPVLEAMRWVRDGRSVALATVIQTWGSSPRPVGSQLAIAEDGSFCGSVSAGCVEAAVIDAAHSVLEGGPATKLDFGVTNDEAWAVGLSCGGQMAVHIARVGLPALEALEASIVDGRPVALLASLTPGGEAVAIEPDGIASSPEGFHFQRESDAHALVAATRVAFESGATQMIETSGGQVLVRPYVPPLRVVVVGAVHIARPLVPMVTALGWRAVVVDPRAAFADTSAFPDAQVVCDWPASAFEELELDRRTAVVTLTHDPKLDDPALIAALSSDAFYVGALGSRRTHARRLERLEEHGVHPASLSRLHAPVGLAIGARTPEEIAVSIVSQIVAVHRSASDS